MNILSLFDGISVARVALERANIKVNKYYSCEIDKYAIHISNKNYPDIIRLNDVRDIKDKIDNIELLIGGSPCQDLSIAKKGRKGLEGERSGLFWEYVRIKELMKPKYFILENVASMPSKDKEIISQALGVQPIMFNASLVSAQTRKRYFWTNIKFDLPEDRCILLKDILESDAIVDDRMVNKEGKSYAITASYSKAIESNSVEKKQRTMVKMGHINDLNNQENRVYSTEDKSCTLTENNGGFVSNTRLYKIGDKINDIRKLTPIECERLQSLPDNYTEGVAKTNRYKMLGNAFNAEVITHILKQINI